ncbi:WLM domain containing protein [Metarhizium album ARSEF 1941]|uniref:WLM domain containing protein n=1 Tax=Metarhizium album (strain ARSEF 1941) TaxID=1081103 RepID=A0A0B2WQU1_METAS|nr:WLM domain containing protein [Metarhizium album ARSEF 1941]KHN95335.1 WLM domain containing protein [Metarhizium album ARSEF 1941]
MPIGIRRLNAKKSQPNPGIVFIKPLPGPHEKTAHGFLERIAAQCLPVTRKHHISIMTLEEHEPNREFVGRNFNAGEVIQLVLRSPSTGRWLPFEYVQMVMMHELAHCKQMNHSRAFWAVRNQYAAQMYELWKEGYTGDGIWGRGASLATGEWEWERNQVRADEVLPEHLCGGTFRSRRRKRRPKPALTYGERKERRNLKKFGKNGIALGADEEAKVKLEKGKRVQAKPRVASSARGRELRAAAALARFEQKKAVVKGDEEDDQTAKDEAEPPSEGEYEDDAGDDGEAAVDVDGSTLRDGTGRAMVRVCQDEDTSDPDARNELGQLAEVFRRARRDDAATTSPQRQQVKAEPQMETWPSSSSWSTGPKEEAFYDGPRLYDVPAAPAATEISKRPPGQELSGCSAQQPPAPNNSACSMCSFANSLSAVACAMCAHVLDPTHTPNSWRCTGAACADSQYVNSGDCGVCGLCGRRRS